MDISDPEVIRRSDEISGGKHLLAPTFPELLRAAGKKVALVGTKSVAILFDRHNEWTVLRMRFVDDLTQSEIGRRIGVSQMQISRISRRALWRLLQAVRAEDPADEVPASGKRASAS